MCRIHPVYYVLSLGNVCHLLACLYVQYMIEQRPQNQSLPGLSNNVEPLQVHMIEAGGLHLGCNPDALKELI